MTKIYKSSVDGEFVPAVTIPANQTLDLWYCDVSGSMILGQYTINGTTLSIYCLGEMRWNVKDPESGNVEIWRNATDISVETDDEIFLLLDKQLVDVDMNCWFEAFFADDDESTNLIGGSIDEILEMCWETFK